MCKVLWNDKFQLFILRNQFPCEVGPFNSHRLSHIAQVGNALGVQK